jgi:hypothetical protein
MGITADVLTPAVALSGRVIARTVLPQRLPFRRARALALVHALSAGLPPDQIFPGQLLHPRSSTTCWRASLFAPRCGSAALQGAGPAVWAFVAIFMLVRIPIDATRYYSRPRSWATRRGARSPTAA